MPHASGAPAPPVAAAEAPPQARTWGEAVSAIAFSEGSTQRMRATIFRPGA